MNRSRECQSISWFFLGLGLAFHCAADGLDTWTSRNSGTTNNLNAVTYGASNFLAVGDSGKVLTSSNGLDWVNQSSGTTNNLKGITYGNGLFVAVGQGPVRTSPDGLIWTAHSAPASTLYAAVVGNGLFVAVGAGGAIVTSANAVNWARQTSGTGTDLLGITYARGRFIAVGGAPGVALVSTDGTNWTNQISGPTTAILGVTFARNNFVAVGGSFPVASGASIRTSPDGLTWNVRNAGPYATSNNFYSVAYGNGAAVLVGGGEGFGSQPGSRVVRSSVDDLSWVTRLTDTNGPLNGITFGRGSFVAVGPVGAIVQSGPVFTLAGTNALSQGGFALSLAGEIGRSYRIQTSANLAGSNWEDMFVFTATDETMAFLDSSATNLSARYYRAVSP